MGVDMKTLLLLRHAKSSWENHSRADFDRPLNDRGRRDAPRMGELLNSLDLVPDRIITSAARRAATTAERVAESSRFDGDIIRTDELYLADPETYINLARQTDDSIATLMMVGHNPGIEELVEMLGGRDEGMPTAALACIRLSIDSWREISPDETYTLENVWRPREL